MNGKRKTAGRFISMILSIILTLSCVPADSYAAEDVETKENTKYESQITEFTEETSEEESGQEEPAQAEAVTWTYVSEEDFPDNDELFAGYVEHLFYGNGGTSMFSVGDHAAGASLTGNEKLAYDAMLPVLKEIASGDRASAVVSIGQKVNTGTELLEPDIQVTFQASEQAFNLDLVLKTLLADCPYEMYWCDKTRGTSITTWGNATQPQMIVFSFTVAENYQQDGNSAAVDTGRAKAAAAAAGKAAEIVEKYKNVSDYEKLVGYKNEICSLVSYDSDAADRMDFSKDNDPWQLIHVFDGDPETNVVCEGYSKAFQYLCDLTEFNSDISCYSVTGVMSGGTGEGLHMWNIVTMEDGENYLVDITNSDAGTIGENGGLFLAGGATAEKDFYVTSDGSTTLKTLSGYTFTVSSDELFYAYDDNTKNLWGTGTDSILNISDHDYVPPTYYDVIFNGTNVVSSGAAKASDRSAYKAALTSAEGYILPIAITVTVNGRILSGDDYSYENGQLTIPVDKITGNIEITVAAEKCIHIGGYTYSAEGAVITAACKSCGETETVTLKAPKNLSYDGMEKEADVDGSFTGTVIYKTKTGENLNSAPVNAGDYIASITLGTGDDAATASVEFTIAPKEISDYTIETSNETFTYDGTAQTYSSVTVKMDGVTIPANEYEVAYENNVNAGTGSASLIVRNAEGGNHMIAEKSVVFDIQKRAVTIKADDKNMDAGTAIPELTYQITSGTLASGDVFSDAAKPSCNADVNTSGTYDIVITNTVINNSEGHAVTDNYNITYINGILTVKGHVHNWTYHAEGAAITATCQADGCTVNTATVTLTAPSDLRYTGERKEAAISGSIEGVVLPEIQYEGNCTDAGAHSASLTLGEATAEVEFTIEKALINSVALDVTVPVAGAAPQSSVVCADGYTGTISWDCQGEFVYNTAYTATVTLTPDNNHQFVGNLTVDGFNVTDNDGVLTLTKTFAATAKARVTNVIAPTVSKLDDYCSDAEAAIEKLPDKITCETEQGNVQAAVTWSCENYNPAVKEYNTFTWTINSGELDNYDLNGAVLTGAVSVQNADSLSVNHTGTDAEITFNGSTYDVSGMFSLDANAGDVSYSIEGGTGTGTLNGTVLTITKAGTIVIKVETAAAGAYGAGETTAVLTVNKAEGSGTVTIEDWTYGETAKLPNPSSATNGTANVTYKYSGTGTTNYAESADVPENAGTYKVIAVFEESDLYASCTAEAGFTITKAAGTVTNKNDADAYAAEYMFTNSAITAPTADNFSTNSGSTNFTFTWYAGDTVDENRKMAGAPSAVGTYTLQADAAETANYSGASTTMVVKIKELVTDAAAILADANKGNGQWYVGDVTVLAPNGYTISTSQAVNTFGDSLNVSEDMDGEYHYYLKDLNGFITAEKVISIKRDTIAPDGEIKVETSSFKEFINEVTFGLFFKKTVNVTISAEDALSGIASVEYQKVAEEADYSADGTWVSGSKLSVTPNEKFVLYARITDNAGNIKIINSDGVVVYTDSAQVTTGMVYIKTTQNDMTAEVTLNGNTIDTVSIERNGIKTRLAEGKDYAVNDTGNEITLSGTYLDTLEAGSHKLIVSYKPMGETYTEASGNEAPAATAIALQVELAEGKINAIENLSKNYDGKPVETPKVTATNDVSAEDAVTAEYKLKDAEDSAYTTTAPTEVGEYMVRVTVAADEFYKTVSSVEEFEITKAIVSATINPSVTSQAPGKTIGVTVTVNNQQSNAFPKTMEVKVKNADGTFDTVKLTGTKAGIYTGTYTVPENVKAGTVIVMSMNTTDENFQIADLENSVVKITVCAAEIQKPTGGSSQDSTISSDTSNDSKESKESKESSVLTASSSQTAGAPTGDKSHSERYAFALLIAGAGLISLFIIEDRKRKNSL